MSDVDNMTADEIWEVADSYKQRCDALEARIRRARQAALQIGRARTSARKEQAFSRLLRELSTGDK